jgi:heme/copper-type cytochrome/quinol oxidase subunit 2
MTRHRLTTMVVPLVLVLCTLQASACSACFGQSDSELARGMNFGIMTLLIVVMGVLGAIAAFFVYLVKRGSKFPVPGPEVGDNVIENPTKA